MSKLYTRCQNCREIYEKEKPYCPSCNTPTNYEDKTIKLIECPACKKEVSSEAPNCPNCGQPINTKTKCPKCGSYNTKPISNSSKVISTIMWGALATNKVISKNECLNCKHKF
ncbi:MAG: zinc ribbon domain-containing protein [Bacilli bacterium]|nr:zinc ribbon domain-containing protein [Bacilli bacterium]